MWISIDEDYLQYMKLNGDHRIPNQDYGEGRFKPFFKLFSIGDLHYVTQINHAQKRHNKMSQMEDFFKLTHDNKTIGIVNLNYMFPVLESHVHEMSQDDIRKILSKGRDAENVDRYLKLLFDEENEICRQNIPLHANLLYEKYKNRTASPRLFQRCCDFGSLEKVMIKFELDKIFDKETTTVKENGALFFVGVDDEKYTLTYNDLNNIHLLKEVHEYSIEHGMDLGVKHGNERGL